jgi:hypothetical protein
MKELLKKIGEKVLVGYLYFVCVWVSLAFTFDLFMIYTHFTNEERERHISNEIMWKIDGLYKNNPDNIWYEEPEKTN